MIEAAPGELRQPGQTKIDGAGEILRNWAARTLQAGNNLAQHAHPLWLADDCPALPNKTRCERRLARSAPEPGSR